MSLKTPLFLILIVGSVCLISFFIWPAYGEIGPKQQELKASRDLVDSIRVKNANMAKLIASLNDARNDDRREFVFNFIPLEKREEKIFNSLSAIAGSNEVNVALGSVALETKKELPVAVEQAPQTSQDVVFGSAPNPDGMVAMVPAAVLPPEKTIRAKVLVLGKYENVKKFVEKLYALDMLKRISSINLTSAQGEGGAPTENISADITADFVYISGAKINKNYNSSVFEKNQFNFASVDEIKALLLEKATAVMVESAGRSNPFLP